MESKIKKFWRRLGPGLITGAADDEPSGIATYSIAGARFGYAVIWMSLFTLPLMIAIQEMSARIGRISNRGLAGNMKKFYPRWILILMSLLIVSVNTINIGSDISGIAHATSLILPFPEQLVSVIAAIIVLLATILLPYKKIVTIFKWLSLSLFAYVFATFTVHQDWPTIIYHTIVPTIHFTKDFFIIVTAFFGTTIAPYLFFWQANQEAEERVIEQCKPGRICHLKPVTDAELKNIGIDTKIGMGFSNLITFFIIALTTSTLFKAGIHNIETLQDAADALKPLAGEYSYLLFTIGIISSGFLAIPILAGSAAYVMSEIFNWPGGLNQKFHQAKAFYGIIIVSTIIGLLIPILGFDPVKALFYTSILYGFIAPFIIIIVIHMANNKKIVGEHTSSKVMNALGYIAFVVMAFFAGITFFIL